MKSISVLLCFLGIATFTYSQASIQFINKPSQSLKVASLIYWHDRDCTFRN